MNPRWSIAIALAEAIACIAACIAMGAALAGHIYDRLHPSTEETT